MALVPQEKVPAFKQQLIQHYYEPLVSQGVVSEADLPCCLFASSPSGGAAVLQPDREAVREPELAVAAR